MSEIVEARYRRAMKWYPKAWRDQHGSVMLGTLLDVAENEGRTSPPLSEHLDLMVNGLLTRAGHFASMRVRDGVASVALATGAAYAIAYFLVHAWAPWADSNPARLTWISSFGPFVNPGVIVCLLWAAAFLAAQLRQQRLTRALLGTAVLACVVIVVFEKTGWGSWMGPSSLNLAFFASLAVLGMVGSPASRPRLLVGTAAALALLLGAYAANGAFSSSYLGDRFFWMYLASPYSLGVAIPFALVIACAAATIRRPVAAAIIALSTVPWTAAWLVGIASEQRGGMPLAIMLCCVIVAALTLVWVLRHIRGADAARTAS